VVGWVDVNKTITIIFLFFAIISCIFVKQLGDMKLKIEIKNRWTGKILFEFESENNNVKNTLLEAIKSNADLSDANLRNANLRNADLSNADLSGANLSNADLSGANLSWANLRGADLSGANLSGADLSNADLSYSKTDKRYIQVSCIGSSKRLTTYCFEDDIVLCGCFKGTLSEFEAKVKETHENNEQYLKEYLGFINYIKSLK